MRFDPEIEVPDLALGTLRLPQQPVMILQNRIEVLADVPCRRAVVLGRSLTSDITATVQWLGRD